VSRDDDRPGFLDREKKSFSERDRMRREWSRTATVADAA